MMTGKNVSGMNYEAMARYQKRGELKDKVIIELIPRLTNRSAIHCTKIHMSIILHVHLQYRF